MIAVESRSTMALARLRIAAGTILAQTRLRTLPAEIAGRAFCKRGKFEEF
jgi:hypothetical protein